MADKILPIPYDLPCYNQAESSLSTMSHASIFAYAWTSGSDRVSVTSWGLQKQTLERKRNILITSALPYVNNIPHLGNVIGSVLSADCFARYCKSRPDYQCLFICGTDEYGTATETKALEEGVTPEELCAKYNKIHKAVYDWFEIEFDEWGRTPTQEQTDIAQDIFLKLHENGYLLEKTTLQPFCEHPKHQAFLADRYVEGICPKCGYNDARGDQCDQCGNLLDPLELGEPRCKLDGQTPVPRETKHMYLSLDKLQAQIDEWQQDSYKKGQWSSNGFNIAQSWIKTGLEPRGITRDLKFGTPIPLPGYENKVMYVWFDACIGYVSITATYTKDWEKWWRNPEDVQLYQFMGKDNTPFHAVVFPGSQLGTKQKWTMVHHISTTEYLNYEKGKFSKSRGIGVFGTSAKEIGISPDVWRYYLLSHRPETGDSEFEWEAFVLDNNYLLNNLGNLVNRTVKFTASKTYDSIVPDYTKATDPLFDEFKKNVNAKLKDYLEAFEKVKLRGALAEAMATSQLGNKLLQDVGLDNKLAAEQPEKCAALVGIILNHLHLIAAIIAPYMPGTSKSILQQLNAKPLPIPETFSFDTIPVGHKIGAPAYLFTNIKAEKAAEWRDQFGGAAARKAKEEAAKLAAEKKASKKKGKDGAEKPKQVELTPEEEEAKKAAKKAAKAAKKEKGRLGKPGAAGSEPGSGSRTPADEGKGVEAAEKEGVVAEGIDKVEQVAEGIKQAHLQSS